MYHSASCYRMSMLLLVWHSKSHVNLPSELCYHIFGSFDTITEEMIKAQQQIAQRLFKNITLGELLGQGSYGTVYQGKAASHLRFSREGKRFWRMMACGGGMLTVLLVSGTYDFSSQQGFCISMWLPEDGCFRSTTAPSHHFWKPEYIGPYLHVLAWLLS